MNLVIERWSCYDEDGIVYGYPSEEVEVDVALHNEKAVLVEVTSHARAVTSGSLCYEVGTI